MSDDDEQGSVGAMLTKLKMVCFSICIPLSQSTPPEHYHLEVKAYNPASLKV